MMNYCPHCGGTVSCRIPAGDDRMRYTCVACRQIFYENPKVVAGAIPVWDDRILLCRRAIEPRLGKWTLPAGYLENGETIAECAVRETREEAGAAIVGLVPYALINLPDIGQVYFIYRAHLKEPVYQAGSESQEVKLFEPGMIPWDELSFASIRKTLELYCRDVDAQHFSGLLHEVVLRSR